MGERRSSAQAQNVRGRAARREAASLISSADRRMSKLRPSCRVSHAAGVRSRSKRQTHFDRPSGGRGAESGPSMSPTARAIDSQPPDQCPASEAINSNRQTGVQRRKRSTPKHRTGVQRAKGLSLQPPDWTEDEGPASTPSFRPALPAKDQRQLRFGSIPSWETGGERIILRSDPCNRDHAPRFLWSETLEKA